MTDEERKPGMTLKDLFELARHNGHDEPDGADGADDSSSGLHDLVSLKVTEAKIEPSVLVDAVMEQIDSLLDIEVAEVIASAWSKAKQLQEYRDPARHPPGELATVSLVEHTIQSEYQPSIDMLINSKSVESLSIKVSVELTLAALILEIRDAYITAIRPGLGRANGRVAWTDVVFLELETQDIELPGRHALPEGIEIPDLKNLLDTTES